MSVILASFLSMMLLATAGTARADAFDDVRLQIREVMASQNVPSISVAVAHKGRIVWEDGFGFANIEQRTLADAHTLYSLASISKPVTATALMILVERGAIDLDKPMNDYLGAQKLVAHVGDARQATVRRVANHTSGLPLHYQFLYEDEKVVRPSMEESIRRYGTLVRAPGEASNYSNFGYGLLEYAIERVSGKPYDRFMLEELFLPLGLTESAVNRMPDLKNRVALRYGDNRSVVPFYDFDHRGASAVFMSAHDLVRFGMFHLHGTLAGQQKAVLQKSTLARMRDEKAVEGANNYGIGWGIGERYGLKHFGHTGGMPGVSTRLSVFPEADLVIAVLANTGTGLTGIESAIVHAVLPETIRHDHGFKPQPGIVGRWKGAVHAYTGPTPVELEFKENGSVFARVGSGTAQEVSQVRMSDDGALSLRGIAGDIGTPDARRYPYRLNLSLNPRGPDVLNGAASAVSLELPDRAGNALSYWVELSKVTGAGT